MTRAHMERSNIIGLLVANEITIEEAAETLELSVRQIERMRAAFNKRGSDALVHGNAGRHPSNSFEETVNGKIIELATGKYAGFNHSYFTEMLQEHEDIVVSRRTVNRILSAAHIASSKPARRRSQHRKKRNRRDQEGAMLQMDGSTHHWCEERAEKMTIISAIDDATNRLWSIAREGEDLEGYMRLLRSIILEWGIPRSIYTDRSAIAAGASNRFKAVKDIQLGPSQLQRALAELGCVVILANSGQAKGRVERNNATLQDRFISYLRLHNASTLKDVNHSLPGFLQHHNNRFVVEPANLKSAWKHWDIPFLIDDVLCIKERRVVAKDHTVRIHGNIFTVPIELIPGSPVMVHRRYDGSMGIFDGWNLVAGTLAEPAPGEGYPVVPT